MVAPKPAREVGGGRGTGCRRTHARQVKVVLRQKRSMAGRAGGVNGSACAGARQFASAVCGKVKQQVAAVAGVGYKRGLWGRCSRKASIQEQEMPPTDGAGAQAYAGRKKPWAAAVSAAHTPLRQNQRRHTHR